MKGLFKVKDGKEIIKSYNAMKRVYKKEVAKIASGEVKEHYGVGGKRTGNLWLEFSLKIPGYEKEFSANWDLFENGGVCFSSGYGLEELEEMYKDIITLTLEKEDEELFDNIINEYAPLMPQNFKVYQGHMPGSYLEMCFSLEKPSEPCNPKVLIKNTISRCLECMVNEKVKEMVDKIYTEILNKYLTKE